MEATTYKSRSREELWWVFNFYWFARSAPKRDKRIDLTNGDLFSELLILSDHELLLTGLNVQNQRKSGFRASTTEPFLNFNPIYTDSECDVTFHIIVEKWIEQMLSI